MTQKEFNNFLDDILDQIQDILGSKADEYASNTSRFHNFERAARMVDTDPINALRGMQLKHRVSIQDMLDNDIHDYTFNQWKEKILDNVNYYFLLLAMIKKYKDQKECKDQEEKKDKINYYTEKPNIGVIL